MILKERYLSDFNFGFSWYDKKRKFKYYERMEKVYVYVGVYEGREERFCKVS